MFYPDVVDGVHRIEDAYTSWYVVEDGGPLTVVETGVPASWKSFEEALGKPGRRPADLEAVVLIHAYFDHLGLAERARAELGVPVWVHERRAARPASAVRARPQAAAPLRQPRALPIVGSLVDARAFFVKPVREVRPYTDGVLPVPGSPRAVYTPGHTVGHCSPQETCSRAAAKPWREGVVAAVERERSAGIS